ncbi:MAG TPA: hypothetical protein PKE59_10790 [Novosphingobium sp.]|mgnify:FL=1|jgi:hypothetical protein|nr:hypothetical protein [Novosphingobium sp.]
MIDLADRALRKLRELQFNRDARAVLASPPVRAADDGVILFSMIGTRVVLPYLVAAKSLHARLGRGRFAILDDGTLTSADKDLLARHLGKPEIRSIHDVDTGACPRGGCWERLLTLLDLRRDAYVIQLDSDTVTLGPVEEIVQAIAQGRDFTLRGDKDALWLPVERFAADLAGIPASAHVQTKTEAVMAQLCAVLPEPRHYVRGCAGFAGFAPGGLDRSAAEAFSRKAEEKLGPGVWSQWGSEQVMSNVIIANEGEPVLLPYDRYLNFWNEPVGEEVAFVHFVGTYRYHGGVYAQAARRAIAALDGALRRAA